MGAVSIYTADPFASRLKNILIIFADDKVKLTNQTFGMEY